MKKILLILFVLRLCACARTDNDALPRYEYKLKDVHEVNGRQGIAVEGDYYYVSGSTSLAKYDRQFNLVEVNEDPFEGYEIEVNHIGDIDVYNNEIYVGAELFIDGVGKNIQVAVYDADTLKLKRVFPFDPETGQLECSGIAVDYDHDIVYMTSWVDDYSSAFLYMYDLNEGNYLGKVHLFPRPEWCQGIAYYDGYLYITCDDGNAEDDEADHLYRVNVDPNSKNNGIVLEKTFDDVIKQGEIEGLIFDRQNKQFLLLYNRGARIILGMPSGFYEGYDHEIHEVFVYDLKEK